MAARRLLDAILLFALSALHPVAAFTQKSPELSYDSVYAHLSALSVDESNVAPVHNMTIVRDAARFHLDSGFVCLLTPVAGRVIGALFWGTGDVVFTPPTAIEREQLQRFYSDSVLHRSITSLFILCTDTTIDGLRARCTFASQPLDRDIQKLVSEGISFLRYEPWAWFDPVIIDQILNERFGGLFHAQVDLVKGNPLFFRITPGSDESIALLRGIARSQDRSEIICQFRPQNADTSRFSARSDTLPITINRYVIECTIPEDLSFTARAVVDLRAVTPGQAWVRFRLLSTLAVDSVRWEDGRPATFFQGKDNPDVWVRCDHALAAGESRTCTLVYHGGLIRRWRDWFVIEGPTSWYPTSGSRETAMFDLTFHVADEYSFVAVGDSSRSAHDGGMVTSHWRTAHPIRNASFNIGLFDRYDVADSAAGPVSVLMGRYVHSGFGTDMIKNVTEDITKSLAFFDALYGKLPVSHFYATEIPGGHGEAFPGLIHLAGSTFQQQGTHGNDEIFRAHEVAHQWWGIGVDFTTYHDQWISEGISDFSGLWYMQTVLHDNAKYFERLELWKRAILQNRKYLISSGQEAGPIWLGYRTNSSTTRGDYDLIIYKKGAWVMQMLRNMFLNVTSMNEDVFIGMLRDAQHAFSGKRMSTEDFREIVERRAGRDMHWFFTQWIYGTDIPTYACASRSEKTADDKYIVHCRIAQHNVPASFQMPMIVKVEFGDDKFARVRINVTGAISHIDLPLMPLAPKKIIFNDLESVLCTVENVDW